MQQLSCPVFQAAWHKLHSKRNLWDQIRNCFRLLLFNSMTELLLALVHGIQPQAPVFEDSS